MTRPTVAVERYRPCVGAVIFNSQGRVWLGRRANETRNNIWQFPQGGIDAGEDAAFAARREVQEETGIAPSQLALIGQIEQPLYYDLPDEFRTTPRTQKWQGQCQRWFAYRFLGTDRDIDIFAQDPHEFSIWKWGDIHAAVDTVVPFKRNIYAYIAKEFGALAKAGDIPKLNP